MFSIKTASSGRRVALLTNRKNHVPDVSLIYTVAVLAFPILNHCALASHPLIRTNFTYLE